jgi:hypothetical protein
MEKREDIFAAPDQQPNPVKKKTNPTVVIVAVVALIALAIFVVRPAVLGYGIYQQAEASNLSVQEYSQNMQQLSQDLELTKANLSSYSVFTGALLTQIDEKNDELTECKVELGAKQSEVEAANQQVADRDAEIASLKGDTQTLIDEEVATRTAALEEQKATCEAAVEAKDTEVGEIQAKYELLATNSARSICCKAKVDNPQINFYEVVEGKITCLEQGANQLNC